MLLLGAILLLLVPASPAWGQTATPAGQNETLYNALTEISEGSIKHLRGKAEIRTETMVITADEMDFDEDTNIVHARGHVSLEHFSSRDKVNADHADYNIKTHSGKFYKVSGTSPAKPAATPWLLKTVNPFYFEAESADRIDDRYILHNGFITDCKLPKPWWTFYAPTFDIIPDDRAIGHKSVFRLKGVPVFYLPYFYRPLGKNPRQSGFLTPEVGNSSLFGYMVGGGYYWAMSPSYDMTGRVQYMTARGPGILYDFRGKPNEATDFDFNLYGVRDSGQKFPNGQPVISPYYGNQGGLEFELRASTDVLGFKGHLDYNYLSSWMFREIFSYSFAALVSNEVDSIGFLQRRFDHDQFTLSLVAQRTQIFNALTQPHSTEAVENGVKVTLPGQAANQVLLDKLPSIEFTGREQQIEKGPVPLWFSLDSSLALLARTDPYGIETNGGPPQATLGTGPYGRVDVEPNLETNFRFKGFSLTPSLVLAITDYTNSYSSNSTSYMLGTGDPTPVVSEAVSADNLFRKDADFKLDFRTPSLERVFTPPKWLHMGAKLKHVIEAEAQYEYLTGVNNFQQTLRLDQMDILSDTNQLTLRVTNRIYRKDKAGNVSEMFTWDVAQARYFDPTFGGAVNSLGTRTVVLASADLMPFAFIDGPRNYSPVVSTLQFTPFNFLSLEWRADYDPYGRQVVASVDPATGRPLPQTYGSKLVDQSYGISFRYKNWYTNLSQNSINTDPLLVPHADQIQYSAGYGNSLRKGWNAGGSVLHDVTFGRDLFENVQVAYNTDCCGFSVRYQHTNVGVRQNENQYLFSFSIANIGTFGSLQHQQRVF